MRRLVKVALLAALISIPGSQVRSDPLTILGVGTVSCGEWTKARADKDSAMLALTSWVSGYLTAYNVFGSSYGKFGNVAKGTDAEGIWAWIDSYCSQNPLKQLALATGLLASELLERQGLKLR